MLSQHFQIFSKLDSLLLSILVINWLLPVLKNELGRYLIPDYEASVVSPGYKVFEFINFGTSMILMFFKM